MHVIHFFKIQETNNFLIYFLFIFVYLGSRLELELARVF